MTDYTVWRTAKGKEIHVQRMTEVHIWNTMSMIRRKLDEGDYLNWHVHVCPVNISDGPCFDCDSNAERVAKMEGWLEAFRVELLRRGMSPEPIWDVLERANKKWEEENP